MSLKRKFMRRKMLFLCIALLFVCGLMLTRTDRSLFRTGMKRLDSRLGKQFASSKLESLKIKTDIDNHYVVFNRVPKCASISMTAIFYKLGAENGFKVASPYEAGEKPAKSKTEQQQFVDYLHAQSHPYMYIRHQYFIDFEKFNLKQPIYINMIRDPIARFESFYYFSRFGNQRGGGGAKAKLDDKRTYETIDECVKNRRPECTKPYWQVVPYFCGQDPGCMSRSQWAVNKAKQNIEKHYFFVGVLEDLEHSLKILNRIMPRYFRNAEQYLQSPHSQQIRNETLTRNKKETSRAAKEFLRTETSLSLEYDLYEFVRNKLEQFKYALMQ